ncbi:hypothetical protein IFM89_035994 [Coptis chinensis]|uniref:S-protein homolog n=1 Tax=Coptis chinensis TaxID=261450 RepID=A0A835ITV8_9MAGN|nr:hypothetical protein IFM89_035994 [Coptis chinensis]
MAGKPHYMYVYNELYPGTPLLLHCKSGNIELGAQTLAYNQNFHWEIFENIWGTTLFWCSMEYRDGNGRYHSKSFDIFDAQHVDPLGNCLECRWAARWDGIYHIFESDKGNGIKDTAAAAQFLSPVVGILASLVHKDLTPNIVPNFRSNIEEAIGLQVLNTSTVELETEKLIDQLMHTEATMWKQRSCIKEEIEGDRNSTYFQAKAKIRQDKAYFEEIRTAKGNILQDQKSIKEFLVQSYEEKFKARLVDQRKWRYEGNSESGKSCKPTDQEIIDSSSSELVGSNMEDEKCAEVQRLKLQPSFHKKAGLARNLYDW